ncbi:MAG: hypothetical protein RBJ76_00715 [Stenomitos frigidus ULC029]
MSQPSPNQPLTESEGLPEGIQLLHFTVEYFQPSGAYYGEGHFDLSVLFMRGSTVHMPDVVKHLQQFQAALPTGSSLPALRPSEGKDSAAHSHDDGGLE